MALPDPVQRLIIYGEGTTLMGSTLDGRDMTLRRLTHASPATPLAPKKKVWLIARQHPGETMAEWFVEGLLQRLPDPADPVAWALLDQLR